MSKGRRGGWSGCRGLHHRGCFLRQVDHLTATAASGKMGQNLPAFPLRKRLLRKGVQALGIGM
jgi:hypothetical protein